MANLGCIQAAIQVAKQHENQKSVLTQAFSLMWYLALNGSVTSCYGKTHTTQDANKATLRDLQCVPLALNALKLHANNASVCAQASGALWNVVVNCIMFIWNVGLSFDIVKARSQAYADGAVPLVMKTLQRHIDDSSVAHPACGALKVIAAVDANKLPMAQAGVLEAFVEALKRHPKNTSVCQQACVGIWNLSVNSAKHYQIRWLIIRRYSSSHYWEICRNLRSHHFVVERTQINSHWRLRLWCFEKCCKLRYCHIHLHVFHQLS